MNVLNASLSEASEQVSKSDFSLSIFIMLYVVYGLISILSVLGNGLIIYTVVKNRKMHNVTNSFICNLACADIIIGLLVAPFRFQAAYLQKWIFPSIVCKIAPFASTLSVNVSIATLCIISIDRYYVIVNPFAAKLSKRHCFIIIVLVWLLSFIISLPNFFNFYTIDLQVAGETVVICQPINIKLNTYYTMGMICFQYLLPFMIILVTYFGIGYHLYFSEAPCSITDNQAQNKRKVIKMIFIVVILFMICWFPIHLFEFVSVAYSELEFFQFKHIRLVWVSTHILAMSNSCHNVFIYGLCSARYKRAFRSTLSFLPCVSADLTGADRFESKFDLNTAHRHSYISQANSRRRWDCDSTSRRMINRSTGNLSKKSSGSSNQYPQRSQSYKQQLSLLKTDTVNQLQCV
nr:G protein-coupled receptor [Proales similis]